LIEAADPGPPSRRPAEYLRTFGTDQDWRLKTTPQKSLARRQLIQPRGRGPGGSTRINAMIWYPPRSCDIDMLQRHGGSKLKRQSLQSSLATVTSWVQPQPPRWLSEATNRFLRTNFPAIEAPHAFLRMGNRDGRVTAADVLFNGTFQRCGGAVDLIIAHVHRVVFDGQRAIGLEVQSALDSTATTMQAEKSVVLCGGAFASPAILLHSGVGPAGKLAEQQIGVRVDAPDVGNHLCDHLIMPIIFGLRDRERFPTQPLMADLARWQIASTGPLTSNLAEAGAIYPLPIGATHLLPGRLEEFQVHVTPTHYLTHPSDSAVAAMTIGVNLCLPKSRGMVSLARPNQLVPPTLCVADQLVPPTDCESGGRALRIDPGYLSDRCDVNAMIAAVRQARLIASDAELRSFVADELFPGADRQTDEAIERAIARFSQTLYHPVGSCRLGTDASSVVDPRGQVRGVDSLYVIDASVLPSIPSVNPNATVMMLAHRTASGLIG
jgi:choline dehydrogenase-like flavoprotein